MHGNSHRLQAPLIAGVNAPCVADDERAAKRRLAIKERPHAMASVRFVLDLQAFESRPAPIGPADIKRRELALQRAAALALTTPIWPRWPPKVVWTPELHTDPTSTGGWVNGERVPKERRERLRLNGTKRYRKADGDEGEEGEPVHWKPLATHPETEPKDPKLGSCSKAGGTKRTEPDSVVVQFPLTLAAAQTRELSQFRLGDALIAETGNPGNRRKGSDGKDGSHARVAAAREALLANGIDYRLVMLLELRAVAFAFPPAERHPGLCWNVHRNARSPQKLREIIAGLPRGETLTVAYIRRIRWVERNTGMPRGLAWLTERMVVVLKKLGKAARIACLAGLAKALGIELRELAAPACHIEAAKRLAVIPAVAKPLSAVA
jgi:hypothetical protein